MAEVNHWRDKNRFKLEWTPCGTFDQKGGGGQIKGRRGECIRRRVLNRAKNLARLKVHQDDPFSRFSLFLLPFDCPFPFFFFLGPFRSDSFAVKSPSCMRNRHKMLIQAPQSLLSHPWSGQDRIFPKPFFGRKSEQPATGQA